MSRSSEATLCTHQYPGTAVVIYVLIVLGLLSNREFLLFDFLLVSFMCLSVP
jgi:hypothetical protein